MSWRDLFSVKVERDGAPDSSSPDLSDEALEKILAEGKGAAAAPQRKSPSPSAPTPSRPTPPAPPALGGAVPGAGPTPGTGALPPVPRVFPLDKVYFAGSVPDPPNGYGVARLSEVMNSPRMKAMTPEMRVGSVMTALDMTGVPLAQIVQDAAARATVLADYATHLRNQAATAATARRGEIAAIEADIAAYAAQRRGAIAALESEIRAAEGAVAEFEAVRAAEEGSMYWTLEPLLPPGSNPIRPPAR